MYKIEHKKTSLFDWSWSQRHKDSNLEMTESESVALPFGDGAISCAGGFPPATMI